MANWKCNACGGVYSDTLLDGAPYFHACPPGTPGARNENLPLAPEGVSTLPAPVVVGRTLSLTPPNVGGVGPTGLPIIVPAKVG